MRSLVQWLIKTYAPIPNLAPGETVRLAVELVRDRIVDDTNLEQICPGMASYKVEMIGVPFRYVSQADGTVMPMAEGKDQRRITETYGVGSF